MHNYAIPACLLLTLNCFTSFRFFGSGIKRTFFHGDGSTPVSCGYSLQLTVHVYIYIPTVLMVKPCCNWIGHIYILHATVNFCLYSNFAEKIIVECMTVLVI